MTPDPARTERFINLVEAALALGPVERSAFLDAQCAHDTELRTEIESLLHFEDRMHGLVNTSAVRLRAESLLRETVEPRRAMLQPGESLGDYRIVSLLGEGGMGEVYLAEDSSLGARQVAIKVVKRGMATDTLLRHFRQEREILAGLNHPCIARLYGGAVTADGLPYFVMEYVEGEAITVYCDQRMLPISARLELFRKVCAALAYAHRRLIVHRDLKPANIRVTPEGEPKLLDFGIAKLLIEPRPGTPDFEQTATVAAALTPAYASPEQLRGESMMTATDIYSLGVVLYELLVGQRPFETKGRRMEELIRAICEQIVERPSMAVRRVAPDQQDVLARSRSTSPARLARGLTGDLDNIVLMALRKEPDRRYGSVDQFSKDVQQHLDGRPVAARRETLRYVGAKFIQRNKAAAAIASLLVVSLIGGIVATSWQARRADEQRRRAERRFEDVRRLADSLLFEIHDSVQTLAGATPTRQMIVSRALGYLDGLSKEADTPALQHDLAAAYEKIGDIQGNPYSSNLGDTEGALTSYRKAETLREGLNHGSPTKESRLELGRSYRALGDILQVKSDYAQMDAYYRRSLAVFEQLQHDFPTDFNACDEYARAYDVLGDGQERLENSGAQRLASYERTLALRQEMISKQPTDRRLRRSVGISYLKVGRASLPDKKRAVDNVRKGLELLRAISREQPDNAQARRDVAQGLFALGNVLTEAGDFAASLPVRRELLPIRERTAAADPKDKQAQFDLAAARADMAEALTSTGDPAGALPFANQSVADLVTLLAEDPGNTVFSHNTAFAYDHLANAHVALAVSGDAATRREHWVQASAVYEKERTMLAGLRQRGELRLTSVDRLQKLDDEITRCQTAMAKAGASSQP